MKSLIAFLSLSLLIASCNNSNNEAQEKQHILDSIKIANLQATVSNVQQTTNNIITAENEKTQAAKENRRKQLLTAWTSQLQYWNTQLDAANANLANASIFHPGRLPSTKKREIQQASAQVEQDKVNVQKCQDSVSKYQN